MTTTIVIPDVDVSLLRKQHTAFLKITKGTKSRHLKSLTELLDTMIRIADTVQRRRDKQRENSHNP